MTPVLRTLDRIPKVWGVSSFFLVFLLSAAFGAYSVSRTAGTVQLTSSQPPNPPRYPPSLKSMLLNVRGERVVLQKGSQGSVILTMAPWCRFCGYEDRWVLPHIAQAYPSVAIDVVDVSYMGGIASPGPEYPPFHGADGQKTKTLPEGKVLSIMRQYIRQLHLSQTALNFYVVAPHQTVAEATSIVPQWYVFNSQGVLVAHYRGALTLQQASPWIYALLKP